MALAGPPILRHWDGRTKIATAWNINAIEHDLCQSTANCLVYLSESQPPNPCFKVTFDQLVAKQCQPLLKNLTLDSTQPASDTTSPACHLDRPRGNRASWDVPLSSWTCSLTLPPPKLASHDDVLLYNVTTRNFFAWIVGAPIVGYNPTSALVALKSRMDIWRAAPCDNVAALQSYATSQSYGYLAGLHLVNTSLLRSTPFIPADYTLTSPIDSPDPPTSDLSKPQQLGLSLRKRAGSILRRKPDGVKLREAFSSRPSSAPAPSNMPDAELNGLPFMSGALSGDMTPPKLSHVRSIVEDASWLGSAYDAISDNGKSSYTSTTTDRSSGLDTLSSKTTNDTLPDMPELEATYSTIFKDFAQPSASSSWLPDFSHHRSQVTSGSVYQSPTIDPPRSYSNANNRHSFSGDRRRQSSRSRPPSPIMEEVVEPVRKRQSNNSAGKFSGLRRLSLPPVMNRTNPSPNTVGGPPVKPSHRSPQEPQEDDRSLASTKLSRLSTDSASTICANCNRCKKPCSPPATQVQLQSPTNSDTRSISRPNLPSTPIETSAQHQSLFEPFNKSAQPQSSTSPADMSDRPFLSEGRWLSAKSKSKELLREPELTRFPSLRRREQTSAAPPASDLPRDTDAPVVRNTGRLRSTSQAPPVTKSITFEPVIVEVMPRRSLDQVPLSEQRYSSPTIARTTTERPQTARTATYDLTEECQFLPVQKAPSNILRSPIRVAPATERRTSRESARRQSLQLRVSTPMAVDESKTTSLDVPSFPEPMSSVIMKSNGSKVSLALPHDENSLLSVDHPSFIDQVMDNTMENRNDHLVFEQLLDGLQFIEKNQQNTTPESSSKPPPKKEVDVTTGFPCATSKPVQEDPPTSPKSSKSLKLPIARLRRFTWTGSIRGWLSRDKSQNDADRDSVPQPTSEDKECQIRVLTLDSHGNFSLSVMESPKGPVDSR